MIARLAASGMAVALLLGEAACTPQGDGPRATDTARPFVAAVDSVWPTPAPPARYGVGRAATAQEVAAWDIDVGPDGAGLPPGRGTPAEGAAVYAEQCASCHGARGEGTGSGAAAYPRLVGREPREGFPFAHDLKHGKTVGNYWPHATTLFDYVRRAMPITAPGSLTPDETYAVVAWLLAENEIVPRDAVLDATTLPRVAMPARERFVRDDRRGGVEFR